MRLRIARLTPRSRTTCRAIPSESISRAYDPIDGEQSASDAAAGAATAAWTRRVSGRVAGLAPPTARLLARAATSGRVVRARLVRALELVGRRLVLGCGAGCGRRLHPAPEPWSAEGASGRCAVAFAAHPAGRLSAGSSRPELGTLIKFNPESLVPAARLELATS